ncbi:protein TolR [Telmatospirillum sp. J64-1]|uniref:protein TolR n=1 Tax=Telmatospirillum sp. J64-1 TaxID=2502183 RepID=UPI00351BC63E
MSEINVTPFVDVMLVLLIIFMVTAPLLTAGIQIELPKTSAAPLPGNDAPLSVSVDQQGRLFIQETEVALEELGPKLIAITNAKSDTRVFVRGDQSVNYGRVMEVMGELSASGFTNLAFVTESKPAAQGGR